MLRQRRCMESLSDNRANLAYRQHQWALLNAAGRRCLSLSHALEGCGSVHSAQSRIADTDSFGLSPVLCDSIRGLSFFLRGLWESGTHVRQPEDPLQLRVHRSTPGYLKFASLRKQRPEWPQQTPGHVHRRLSGGAVGGWPGHPGSHRRPLPSPLPPQLAGHGPGAPPFATSEQPGPPARAPTQPGSGRAHGGGCATHWQWGPGLT